MKAVILAAGGVRVVKRKGKTRYLFPKDSKPKCLHHVGKTALLSKTVKAIRDGGITDIRIVVGYRAEDIIEFNKKHKLGLEIVHNPDWNTDAVKSLLTGIADIDSDVLVLFSDLKNVNSAIIKQFVECPKPLAWIKLKKKYRKSMDPKIYVATRQVYIVKIGKAKLGIFDRAYEHLERSKKRYGDTYNPAAFPPGSGQMILLTLLETMYQNGPVADILINRPIVDVDVFSHTDERWKK